YFAHDAVWHNLSGGEFDLRTDGDFLISTGGPGTFVNDGVLIKMGGTGTSDFYYGVAFDNHGDTQVQTGTLLLVGGGTSAGTLEASAGATLAFGGDYTLTAASAVSGAGAVQLTGGTLTAAGSIQAGGGIDNVGGYLIGSGTLIGNVTNDAVIDVG